MLYRDYATVDELGAQYDTTRGVAQPDAILARWTEASRQARRGDGARLGIRFGPHRDERLDIFCAGDGAPVHVFIHGGYWRRFHAEDFSFVATELCRTGVTVVVINYSLCPEVDIDEIVRQARAALAWTHANISHHGGDPARITVSGHSAGGHLAAMLLATDWERDYELPADIIKAACPISGLFDLSPFPYTWLQPWLQLGWDQVRRCSPLFRLPARGPRMVVTVGGEESAEFQRQSREYLVAWRAHGLPGEWLDLPGRNHFTALDALCEPDHALFRTVLDLATCA